MAKANGKTPPKGTKAELAEIDTLMKKAVELHRKKHPMPTPKAYRLLGSEQRDHKHSS